MDHAGLHYSIMSGEPLFDPSLKKRSKKKQVAFSEDPLGADADPTAPAPPSLDDTTASGDVIDLGPKTVHEQMKQSEAGIDDVASEHKEVKEEEDFKAMFGDLKKKKKKKEIPLDLVCLVCHSFSSY
jgi:translation initiation factor 2 subunit 2